MDKLDRPAVIPGESSLPPQSHLPTFTEGRVLENRIEAIERLAATDPGIDTSLLQSPVLATVSLSNPPSGSSASGGSADSTPLVKTGFGLLALDPPEADSLGAGSSGATVAFPPSASFAGSPAAVPEPSSLMLAAAAAIGAAYALCRPKVNQCPGAAGVKDIASSATISRYRSTTSGLATRGRFLARLIVSSAPIRRRNFTPRSSRC